MYEWKLELYLESGQVLIGKYIGPETGSADVAKKLLAGPNEEFFGIYGENERRNLMVKRGSIAACDISAFV